jgi:hypothetical protein
MFKIKSLTTSLKKVVIWDKIIERPEDAKLALDKATVEYGLIDQGADLRNTTIQLRLVWDHMPLTGLSTYINRERETLCLKCSSQHLHFKIVCFFFEIILFSSFFFQK